MPAGLRLDPARVDMDAFRAFLDAAGAVYATPKDASGEVLRFRIGNAFGVVSLRKRGTLTFAGISRLLVRQFCRRAA